MDIYIKEWEGELYENGANKKIVAQSTENLRQFF